MSIPVLTQVYDEVRRLSIAGSTLASGDFRLKKLVAPLEQAGQKSPVFAKVAQAVQKVVDSNDATSSESLLELSTLVNAILYTQGATGTEGKLEPIKTVDFGLQTTQTPARVLKPLLEALKTVGSGRLEVIKDAFERGAFVDLRLIKPALLAMDDPHSEIADFVSDRVLPLYGKSILPELRAKLDLKGRSGHVRRLAFIYRLDPEGSRDLVKQALEEGSKEIKIEAIGCLGASPEDLIFLLDQSKSKSKDVRAAALNGLVKSDSKDAISALRSALTGNDIELAVTPIRLSRSPLILNVVLELAANERDVLFGRKQKETKELAKHASKFLMLLECLCGRDDALTETFVIDCFQRRDQVVAIKGDISVKDLQQKFVSIMSLGSKRSQDAVASAHAELSDLEFWDAFAAARHAWSPEKVYDEFSPYLKFESGKKTKKGDAAAAKQAVIIASLSGNSHRIYLHVYLHVTPDQSPVENFSEPLDPRWLDLAVELKQLDLVQFLARPDHPAANAMLLTAFGETLKKSKTGYECADLLTTMIHVGHPAATDSLIAAINSCIKRVSPFGLSRLGRSIPKLPKDAVPKLEALLPTLPKDAIDQLHDYVTQLKNKS